jgi:hypothetical protein
MAVAGPLADRVFEPALTSPDSGVGLVAYRIRAIRDVETLIPDHDEVG